MENMVEPSNVHLFILQNVLKHHKYDIEKKQTKLRFHEYDKGHCRFKQFSFVNGTE